MVKELELVDAETLLYEPMEQPEYVVKDLIPTGLTLLSGAQKIGKSWFVLDLCLSVSKGENFLEHDTSHAGVLYLCLEDTKARIQNRMFILTEEVSNLLQFALRSANLSTGLISQLENHVAKYPDTKLIVIDVFQKVRNMMKDSSYANDYLEVSALKQFADDNKIAVLVIHHVKKKSEENDVFLEPSGTMGITGSADTNIVLKKDERSSDTATLYVEGRDIEYKELVLRFSDCRWELVEELDKEESFRQKVPDVVFSVVEFMEGKDSWTGSATELADQLELKEIKPQILSKYLNQYSSSVLKEKGIRYANSRTSSKRIITLEHIPDKDSEDEEMKNVLDT